MATAGTKKRRRYGNQKLSGARFARLFLKNSGSQNCAAPVRSTKSVMKTYAVGLAK
jgi:hypothetical protein